MEMIVIGTDLSGVDKWLHLYWTGHQDIVICVNDSVQMIGLVSVTSVLPDVICYFCCLRIVTVFRYLPSASGQT